MSWINSCFQRPPRSRWRLPYLPYRVYSLHVAILIADHEHRDQDSLVLAISLLIFRPSFLIIVEPKEKFRALFDNFNNRSNELDFVSNLLSILYDFLRFIGKNETRIRFPWERANVSRFSACHAWSAMCFIRVNAGRTIFHHAASSNLQDGVLRALRTWGRVKRSDSLLPLPAIRIGSLSREKRSVDTIYRGGERERETETCSRRKYGKRRKKWERVENGGCVATQDSVPLIGLADRSTRSLEDKDPEEVPCVPGPRIVQGGPFRMIYCAA